MTDKTTSGPASPVASGAPDVTALPTRNAPHVPELIPLNQGWSTQWLVSYSIGVDQDDPYDGWHTVSADARKGTVDFGEEMTPVEARNLGLALLEAARHAESYASTVMGVLSSEEPYVGIDLPDASTEEKRAVHSWFRSAWKRAHTWRQAVSR
jgi:hypothetical protein